jgi:CDP-glucose 4,6-dehydratase
VTSAYRRSFGLRLASARAGNVIGGGDWGRDRLLPDLARARESGEPLVLRHPDALRPWQHVVDPLAGYLTLAERLHGSAEWAVPWNFGPDESRPVGWVVERVQERWPVEVQVADPGDGVEAPELRLDASAARERLQWRPRLDPAAALDATVSWYDEVLAGGDPRAVTLRQIEELS